jgi:hypothetical protein
MNNSTIVTGIWDLNREALSQDWSRSFDHYISNFKNLLNCKNLNLAIFIDPSLEDLVWSIRDRSNTAVYHHAKENFSGNFFPFFDKIQQIRNNPEWYNQVGWLADSTQAKMEFYNPMVMSKMFLLHNAKIFNPFDSDYYWWLDGGITNTVHSGYFTHDNIIEKIEDIVNKFLFVCFPYETSSEIHGFDIEAMKKYCQSDTVNRVARGGFFGGHKDYISQANDEYYSLLDSSLREGYMGTEESIFTIMTYLEPKIYQYEPIEDNGLINTFFENVKNKNTQLKNKHSTSSNKNNDIILYINTFNTPLQLELLIDSYEKYDSNFLTKTQKYLINNSTDDQYNEHYNQICSKYDFNQIKKGNLGVCGGRQWAAEHFAELGAKYMFFFEDDMLIDLSDTECRFGLRKNIKDLFDRIVRLMDIEDYDWIKLSFSEFYGHNGEQWSWHNVPQNLKNEYFPNIKSRPQTRFHNIKSYGGLPYADGEIYYSNWPHIIGQEGNKKSFLDTKWDRPFEQTWMSHMYTLTKQEIIKPAILLASPITHNRVYFYEGTERKES